MVNRNSTYLIPFSFLLVDRRLTQDGFKYISQNSTFNKLRIRVNCGEDQDFVPIGKNRFNQNNDNVGLEQLTVWSCQTRQQRNRKIKVYSVEDS